MAAKPLGDSVQPMRWHGDRLELLDQRLLPDQSVYVSCRTAAEVAQAIRDMVVRGAPAIGCAAAFGVALDNGSVSSFEVLAKSRPTAVNLFWALERMKKAKDLKAEAERRARLGQSSGADHRNRSQEFPHFPAPSLSGRDRWPLSG